MRHCNTIILDHVYNRVQVKAAVACEKSESQLFRSLESLCKIPLICSELVIYRVTGQFSALSRPVTRHRGRNFDDLSINDRALCVII